MEEKGFLGRKKENRGKFQWDFRELTMPLSIHWIVRVMDTLNLLNCLKSAN